MDTQAPGSTSNPDRGVPASVSPGHLRALSEVLRQTKKPPAKLELEAVRKAAADSPTLAGLSAGTPAQIHRGLRNLQLINAADEPTQAYLQLLRGNTDADWKDFIDAHFDYLLHDEVSLLDLTPKELRQRLAEQHPETGKSTLEGTARLIRGMMTRSFEQPADDQATRPLPQQKTAPNATRTATAAPAAPAEEATPAPRKKSGSRRPAAGRNKTNPQTAPAVSETAAAPVSPAAGTASTAEAVRKTDATPEPAGRVESGEAPAAPATRTRRRSKRTPAATAAAEGTASAAAATANPLEVPLSGSITLPLGGSNAATLSWSLTTLDAQSISVVESQLEIASRFLNGLKGKSG